MLACQSMNMNGCVYCLRYRCHHAPGSKWRAFVAVGAAVPCLYSEDVKRPALAESSTVISTSMGKKSDKKVKAERVNALKKQYDAFLEEDKKRKERNEYILGRLDNMRYSATTVQVRHKPIVIGDVMPVIPLPFHRPMYRPEPFERRDVQPVHPEYQVNRPTPQNLQLDLPRTHLDNTALLREISKKYILIPKLRSSVNDYVGTIGPQSLPPIAVSSPQTDTPSKEDWKSKYEILEKLKKKEKVDHTDKYGDEELFPVKEKQSSSSNLITKTSDSIIPRKDFDLHKPEVLGDDYTLQSYDTKESSIKYEQEPPDRDSATDKPKTESEPHGIERSKISDSKIQEPNTEQSTISSTSAVHLDPDEDQETYDGYNLQTHVSNAYAPVESVPATNDQYDTSYTTTQQFEQNAEFNSNHTQQQINDVPQQGEYQYEQPIVSEGKYPDNENVYLDPDDYSPIQVLDTPTVAEQIHNVSASNDATGVKSVEVTEYPVEMLNVQDFTPKECVQLIDGVNVNPKHMASDENVDPGVYESNPQTETAAETAVQQDTSEIEAFDAEQKEMFYSEDTVQYEYNQQQGDGYNQENIAPQENSYYESPAPALQEQGYPAEINEHEESTTRYDPNYEQQYGQYEQQYHEQQEYVQPEGYDQTDPQYAQQEGYDQTSQGYVQQEGYDQTGQEYVQQEGYDQTDQQYVQPAGYDQTDQQQYAQQEGYDQADPQYAQQEDYNQAGQYQNYQYEQQDQDTVQNIEHVMDNEQGYVDQQNYDANQANVAEPLQQAVDQKAS